MLIIAARTHEKKISHLNKLPSASLSLTSGPIEHMSYISPIIFITINIIVTSSKNYRGYKLSEKSKIVLSSSFIELISSSSFFIYCFCSLLRSPWNVFQWFWMLKNFWWIIIAHIMKPKLIIIPVINEI